MKSILYIGATLMIGASIYGFIDYKKASRNDALTKMYQPVDPVPVVEEEDITFTTPAVANVTTQSKELVATPAVSKTVATEKVTKKAVVKKAKMKKKKRLDSRLFSRGRMEEFEMPVVIPEKPNPPTP